MKYPELRSEDFFFRMINNSGWFVYALWEGYRTRLISPGANVDFYTVFNLKCFNLQVFNTRIFIWKMHASNFESWSFSTLLRCDMNVIWLSHGTGYCQFQFMVSNIIRTLKDTIFYTILYYTILLNYTALKCTWNLQYVLYMMCLKTYVCIYMRTFLYLYTHDINILYFYKNSA